MTERYQDEAEPLSPRGAKEAPVQAFGIRGLYGYRNIALSSPFAATILIARNGTGKTTLLGALDAFLRQQFFRLRDLDFEQIYCKLRGVDEELTITREDIDLLLDLSGDSDFGRVAQNLEATPLRLYQFLTEEWPSIKDEQMILTRIDNPVFQNIYRASEYSRRKTNDFCDKLISSLNSRSPNIEAIAQKLRDALSEYDIVYLPTYRRVELALGDPGGSSKSKKQRRKFNVSASGLFTGDIQFGLADISERLSDLNDRIVSDSNIGYRLISANIINELIDGSYERDTDVNRDIPLREDLQLFFSRLEKSRLGANPISDQNLDKLYGDDALPEQSGRFLNYFLNKLKNVILATANIERSVEDFISRCNKYLMSDDATALLLEHDGASGREVIDGKQLRVNRQDLKVHVESMPEGRKISLDALSSGEKQMISLFAKLYLYEKQKIVLIDEPELSLSIDWQRHILIDVMSAPLCSQLIAITHSPFVFDNALEPFARSLQLSVSSTPQGALEGDDIDE